jgi:hypothetical protein
MTGDDWRLRVELPEAGAGHRLLDRIGLDLGSEARELARDLEAPPLAVTHDEDSVFVYAPTRRQAEQAQQVVEAELRDLSIEPRLLVLEHWLAEEDRWDDEPAGATVEEDALARGYAPWEVRVDAGSAQAARELAERLQSEGYGVVRRWRYVIAGVATREDAAALAERVRGEVEVGGELVWEATPANPFALLFGGIGG